MKKIILLFLAFLSYQFTFSQCHYVVDMQDSMVMAGLELKSMYPSTAY